MNQNDFSTQNLTNRRPIREDLPRRLFGWDFTFVLFFLVIAFYYFWPLLFRTPEPYAPETAIQEALTVFMKAKDCCEKAIKEEDTVTAEKLMEALQPLIQNPINQSHILLWQSPEHIILGKEHWPTHWNRSAPPWLNQKNTIFVDRSKGTSRLILFEPIKKNEIYLIIIKQFTPLYKKTGG